jgi:hypothetical protein
MKIKLNDGQMALLKQIDVPYSSEMDYDDDGIIALEGAITDYVILVAVDENQNVTPFGEKLLDLHSFIVREYDS